MNDNMQYAIHDQLERVADGLENLCVQLECLNDYFKVFIPRNNGDAREAPASSPSPAAPPLSLFFESLPTWVYNNLRRKSIPSHLAAKIIGLPQSQLAKLTEIGLIRGKSGRYDLVELLGYLEDTFSEYGQNAEPEPGPVFQQ